jgi:iron complex transport system ATP-binding protein
MATLVAEGLSVERGGRQVVAPLDLTLEPGTITAICGPNGAGKSSLVMALAGLLRAARGRVLLDGEELHRLAPAARARAIGYLPQGADIAWDVAVETLVALGRHPHGDGSQASGRAAVARALAATAMEELRSRPVSRLSGGETARALLARVLAGSPHWILADEPLAALDLAHQLRMIAHLRASATGGQGVVIVLHDLALAMNHADRVVVLREGALLAAGTPEEALSEAVIEQGWGIAARWLGEPGARALVAASGASPFP